MTKTPEQMAEEYASKIYRLKYYVDGRLKPSQGQEGFRWLAGKNGFLAGYHTAYNIAYELGFEEALKAQKTLTYIQAELKKTNENT